MDPHSVVDIGAPRPGQISQDVARDFRLCTKAPDPFQGQVQLPSVMDVFCPAGALAAKSLDVLEKCLRERGAERREGSTRHGPVE
jgi:hypothetical protein